MLRTTRWRPDTCTCDLELEWDDALAPEVVTHVPKRLFSACPEHASKPLDQLHAAVLAENQTKNRAQAVVAETLPLLKDAGFSWSFDPQRNLSVSVAGAIAGQISQLQAAINLKLGRGKVTVT